LVKTKVGSRRRSPVWIRNRKKETTELDDRNLVVIQVINQLNPIYVDDATV
jgi:hypothetical protein